MGRRISDGLSVDVTVPGSTLVEKGELYRIDGWSGFAFDEITTTEVDRAVALEVDQHALWRCKVPAGIATVRGNYVYWTSGTGFKKAVTDLQATPATAGDHPAAKVEGVRNAGGYATLSVRNTGVPLGT